MNSTVGARRCPSLRDVRFLENAMTGPSVGVDVGAAARLAALAALAAWNSFHSRMIPRNSGSPSRPFLLIHASAGVAPHEA
ncbi:MAG TPA: hypothetical protein VLM89_08730 [Phycisphaerae bacterium]|nr:hypothetical protein [Phycisphaerae bacterium]